MTTKKIKYNTLIKGMKCPRCGRRYPFNIHEVLCTKCNCYLEVEYDYERIRKRTLQWKVRRRLGVWAYKELLPYISNKAKISLGEGGTPLIFSKRLIPGVRLMLKNETVNPTGSFLDRGSTVVISLLNGMYKRVTCSVNANLAVSLAAYCAKSDMQVTFFCSPDIDRGEFYQAIALGATIRIVHSQEEARKLAMKTGANAYYIDSANPFLLEGEKTTAFEIIEQLSWKPPDWIVVPVGTGGHLSMIWKAIKELKKLRLIRGKLPRLIGVQTEAFSPLVDLFDGTYHRDYLGTIARDLVFLEPPKILEAYQAIKESRGVAIRVSDDELIASVKELASKEGILVEPAAASTIAAIRKLYAEKMIEKGDSIVAIMTGSGLKNPDIIKSMIRSSKGSSLSDPKIAILKAIKTLGGKGHGYVIKDILREKFNIEVSLPTIYHHLKELEQTGFLRRLHMVNRRRIYYELTTKAERVLDSEIKSQSKYNKI